ncbi:WhiB family transcriptional regulator [Streptomyces sp. NBC_01353]|uniref:WhiB family transcriptional regulator n=1 Tax=Streptomyces sp. NBC_01353 TaxID=2903835 RepID=UPI003DA4B350
MTTETRRPISPAVTRRWRAHAACRTVDPELFFPVGLSKAAQEQAEQAKAVCNMQCPVRTECLEWALENGQQFGVLGGLSQEERWELARVTPRGPGEAMDRCIEAREQIQVWRAKKVPQRTMARRLNVDRSVVRAAVQRFDREDSKQQLEVAA